MNPSKWDFDEVKFQTTVGEVVKVIADSFRNLLIAGTLLALGTFVSRVSPDVKTVYLSHSTISQMLLISGVTLSGLTNFWLALTVHRWLFGRLSPPSNFLGLVGSILTYFVVGVPATIFCVEIAVMAGRMAAAR